LRRSLRRSQPPQRLFLDPGHEFVGLEQVGERLVQPGIGVELRAARPQLLDALERALELLEPLPGGREPASRLGARTLRRRPQ